MKRWRRGLLLLIATPILALGCATTGDLDPEPIPFSAGGHRPEQALRVGIRSWLGTPHRMGGMSRRGIDCSGLVVVLYENLFDLQLPRTTTALMHTGRRVEKENLAAGDLLFFKPRTKVHHVGIYLGQGEFVHTSSRNGVMVSRMNDDFWRRCYLTGRRLL
jgi:cell wall-associated NlpC family hydrolase